MKKIISLFITAIILTSCDGAKAQNEPNVSKKVPSEVGVNQQFQYVVTTNQKGTILESDFGKFEVLAGPSISTSTSIQMKNGSMEQKTEYSYIYILSINKEGSFTIPGVSISVDGKVLRTEPSVVKVVKSSKIAQQNNEQNDERGFFNFQWPDMDSFFGRKDSKNDDKVEYKDDISKEDMFVKAFASQTEAFKGEPIVVTYKLFIKKDIRNYEIARANFASTDAVSISPLELNYRDEETETIKGETYHVYTIKQTAVYPKKIGKVTIPKLDLLMRIGVPAVVNNPFWGRTTTIKAKDFQLTSNDLSIKVKALPNSRNATDMDIIGHFDISATMSTDETSVDRPITLSITVSGNGNLHNIESKDFEINIPNEWDQTKPKTAKHIAAKGNLVSGSTTYRYTLIPHSTGEFYIPAIQFTYFDDETMNYKTISTQDFRITVKESSKTTPSEQKKSSSKGKTYKI